MKVILKITLALIFGFLPNQTRGQVGWIWQHPWPQGNQLNAVWPIDSMTMVAVGTPGVLIRTSDAGNSWEITDHLLQSSEKLSSLSFINKNTGWCIGGKSIFKTTNGGISWSQENLPTSKNIRSITFIDEKHGWIGGDGILLRTIDGGEIWDTTLFPYYQISSIIFINRNIGWFATGQAIYKSNDGGKTWDLSYTSFLDDYGLVVFTDTLHGWVAGSKWQFGPALLRTTDGGASWNDIELTIPSQGISSLFFVDSLKGWLTTSQNFIAQTNDGGITWDTSAHFFGDLSPRPRRLAYETDPARIR